VADPPPARASLVRRRTAHLSAELPVAEMAVVGAAVFTITALAFFRVAILPSIGDELVMSTAQLGLFSATYAVGRVLTDVPAGHLADRLPVMSIMRRAAVLVAAGSLLLAVAPLSAVAFVGIFLLGVGTALANTTGATYFSTVAPVSRRGLAVSGFAAAQLGGQAFGPAISGGLASLGTWRLAELAAAVIAAALVVAICGRRMAAVTARHAHVAPPGSPPATTWSLTRPMLAVLFAIPFVMFLTIGAMIQTLAPVIGKEELGLAAGVIGLAVGLGGLFRFVGAVVGGQVADRIGRKAALVPGLALQSVGVAMLAIGGDLAIWFASIALLSLGSIGTSVAIAVLGDVAPPGTLGRYLGRFRLCGDIGLIIGPIVTAWLYDVAGRAAAVLPVAALVALCALAAAAWIPETRWGDAAARRDAQARTASARR
jgi:MFS family permease